MGTFRPLPRVWLAALALPVQAASITGASHSIRLYPDQRGAVPEGMAVRVRVNEGKPLRLLVDTGASRILVSASAAAKAGLRPAGPARLYGIGERGARDGFRAVAASIRIDSFELRDVEVDVAEHAFPPGVDGLLGPAIFRGYVVRLDTPGSRMELLPSPEAGGSKSPYLLVAAEIKGVGGGLFLVDTGSVFSAIDHQLASGEGPPAPVAGIAGLAPARTLGPVELVVAGKRLRERNAYALDLSELRRRSGQPIAGLIGFSALRHSVLTIDYANQAVRIDGDPVTSLREPPQ